ncbi:MAG: homocysteine S-methyltransferase family protein, partial [Thermoanaerobaculia bacterium]|nr:homocysteine S-methyltransferase family protein [Thermoanaerobaculia bacterium]
MSEVLSPEQVRGEREGDEAEEPRRAEDGEVVDLARAARELAPRDEVDGGLGQLPRLREHPVEAADERGRPLRREGRLDLPVTREDGREKEDGERRHDRDGRRGGDDADEEGEGHQRGDREEDDRAAQEEAGVDDARLPPDEEPHRADEVGDVQPREEEASREARQEETDPAHGAREVEVDRPLLLQARHEVRRGEDGEERRDDVEEAREARLEAEDEAVEVFAEQIAGLKEGGVDVIWIETMSALEEIRAAATAATRHGMPFTTTASFDTAGKTMMGVAPAALAEFALSLPDAPVAVGGNCG